MGENLSHSITAADTAFKTGKTGKTGGTGLLFNKPHTSVTARSSAVKKKESVVSVVLAGLAGLGRCARGGDRGAS